MAITRRVCKLKFRTRQETQDNIRHEHRSAELVRSIGINIGDIIISEKIGEKDHAISRFGDSSRPVKSIPTTGSFPTTQALCPGGITGSIARTKLFFSTVI